MAYYNYFVSPASDVEAVAILLKRFVGLDELQRRWQQEEEYGEDEEEESAGHSSGSEEAAEEL